jgi:hypothetical protein
MNERIRELAVEAKIEFTYDPTEKPIRAFVECWEDELEKFAELLIRKCAMKANATALDLRNYPELDGRKYVGDCILKCFEVES